MAQFEQTGVDAIVKGFSSFIVQMKAVNKSIAATGGVGKIASAGLTALNVGLKGAMIAAGLAAAAIGAIALAVGAFGLASVKAAGSVELAFAGVAKVIPGLTDEFGKMNSEGELVLDEFREMSKEIPKTVEELLRIGELGGQLAVPREELAGFTESIAAISVSTDLMEDEAARGFATVGNIYADTIDSMADNTNDLGSAIVFMGNTFPPAEKQILAITERLAGAGKVTGFLQPDLVGIGTALATVGIEAQAGGTAVQKAMFKIDQAVAEGADTLDLLAETAGISSDEFAATWEEDAAEAFTLFVEGLGTAGDGAFAILDELELADQRVLRTFLSMAGAGSLLRDAIGGANTAFDEGTALAREASIFYATFDSKMKILKNTFRDAAVAVGLELLPALEGMAAAVSPIVSAIGESLGPAMAGIVETIQTDLLPAIDNLIESLGIDIDFSPEGVAAGITGIGESISGVITRISELINIFAEGGLTGLALELGIPQETIDGVKGFVETLKGIDFEPILKIAGFIAIAVGVASGFLAILPTIIAVSTAIAGFITVLGNIGAFVSLAIAAISGGGGLITVLLGIASAFVALVSAPVAFAIALGVGIAAIVIFWKDALRIFNDLKKQVGIIFGALKERLIAKWEEIVRDTKFKLAILKLALTFAWLKIKQDAITKFEEIKASIAEAWENIKLAVQEKIDAIKEAISAKIQEILDRMGIDGEEMKIRWQAIWNDIALIITTIGNRIKNIAIRAFRRVKIAVQERWEQIKTIIALVWEEIRASIETKITVIKFIIDALWLAIKAAVIQKWTEIKLAVATKILELITRANQVFQPIKEKISTIWEEVKTIIKTKWDEIKVATGERIAILKTLILKKLVDIRRSILDTLAKWIEIGQKIIQGVIDGMLKMGGKLAGAITDLVRAALDAAKKALGISSPSKEFFDVGKNIGIGLADGIRSEAANVQDAMMDTIDGIKNLPFDVGLPTESARRRVRLPTESDRSMQDQIMPINTGQTNTNIDRSSNPTVNANYFVAQAPNTIIDDLALVAMLSANR